MDSKNPAENQRTTLNDLMEEQRSLNMRMLLAIQLRDQKTQEELKTALEDVAERIDRMLSGSLRH